MATIGRLVKKRDSLGDAFEQETLARARLKAEEKEKERAREEERAKEESAKLEKERPVWGAKGVWSSTEYGAEAVDDDSPVLPRAGGATVKAGSPAYPVQTNKSAAKKPPPSNRSGWAPNALEQSSLSAKEIIARAAAEATPAIPETVGSPDGAQTPSMIEILAEQLRAERQRCLAAEEKLAALELKNEELHQTLRDAQNAAIDRLERENERMSRLHPPTDKHAQA